MVFSPVIVAIIGRVYAATSENSTASILSIFFCNIDNVPFITIVVQLFPRSRCFCFSLLYYPDLRNKFNLVHIGFLGSDGFDFGFLYGSGLVP